MARKEKADVPSLSISSLQKFKTLEKDYPSFSAQLEEVARTIDQPGLLEDSYIRAHDGLHFAGKADWALRWVTKKLASDDQAGAKARGSVHAWNLLRNLIKCLPIANSTQTLKSSRFLLSVEKAVLASTTSSSFQHKEVTHGHEKHEKKRRKLSVNQDETDTGVMVVASVASCLEILQDLARSAEAVERNLDVEYVRSTLRTDGDSAAKILKGYFLAQSQGYVGSIEPFLSIWHERSQSANDDVVFSKTCLMAALCAPEYSQQRQSRQAIEKLVAQHIILPARNAYHASKAGREFAQTEANLGNLLQPYLSFIQQWTEGIGASPSPSVVASRLLEIGVRSTPLDSHRKRAVEKPWFEALFNALVFTEAVSTGQDLENDELLSALLSVAVQWKLQLSSTLLARIARTHTSWRVTALLLQFDDAGIFVDPAHEDISDKLWTALTRDFSNLSREVIEDNAYKAAKKEIVEPLLNAYASARKLPEFMLQWKRQLATYLDSKENVVLSIWQDPDLTWMLSKVLETSLDEGQITSILQKQLDDVQIKPRGQSTLPSLLLLDAILSALHSTRTVMQLSGLIRSTSQLCIDMVNLSPPEGGSQMRAVLWHLYATCHTLETEFVSEDILQNVMAQDLHRICSSAIEDLELGVTTDSIEELRNHLRSLESLGIILDNLSRRNIIHLPTVGPIKANGNSSTSSGNDTRKLNTTNLDPKIVADIAKICSFARDELNKKALSNWWHVCASTLLRYPMLFLLDADQNKRHQLLFSIVVPKSKKRAEQREDESLMQLAHSLCSAARAEPLLLEDLKNVLYHKTANLAEIYSDRKLSEKHAFVLEEIFLSLPAELVPRPLRERTIDALFASLSSDVTQVDMGTWVRRLSLAVCLLRLPHGGASASAALIPVMKAMTTAVSNDEGSPEHKVQLCGLLSETTGLVLNHLAEHSGDGNNKTLIIQFWNAFVDEIEGASKARDISVGGLILAKELSKLDRSHLSEVWDLHKKLMSRICEGVSTDARSKIQADQLWADAVANLLSAANGDLMATQQSALKHLRKYTATNFKNLEIAKVTLDLSASSGPQRNFEPLFQILEDEFSLEQHHLIQSGLMKSLEQLDADSLTVILRQIVQKVERLGAQRMLATLLMSPRIDWTGDSNISGYLVTLSMQLTKTIDIRSFEQLVTTVNSIVHLRIKNLSQHAVESVLASIATLTSACSPELPASHASLIHSRLTAIMVTLLTSHRRNLRGRFHLLLSPLEGLLRCLFTTDKTLPPKARLQQPCWAFPSATDTQSGRSQGSLALGPAHATALSRLLTLICEPSASAVRSRPSNTASTASDTRLQLIDETAAARAYAGKYMGYFVISLCECMLKGRLTSVETRDALLQPGLWSVLSVVPKDVLEAQASVGVRNEGRAVLRGLLEEWRRAGGGRSVRG